MSVERVLERVVVTGVVLWFKGRRRTVLTLGWISDRRDDSRYARAQRRGERLIRQMHRDGTLAARSPRKVVRLP